MHFGFLEKIKELEYKEFLANYLMHQGRESALREHKRCKLKTKNPKSTHKYIAEKFILLLRFQKVLTKTWGKNSMQKSLKLISKNHFTKLDVDLNINDRNKTLQWVIGTYHLS